MSTKAEQMVILVKPNTRTTLSVYCGRVEVYTHTYTHTHAQCSEKQTDWCTLIETHTICPIYQLSWWHCILQSSMITLNRHESQQTSLCGISKQVRISQLKVIILRFHLNKCHFLSHYEIITRLEPMVHWSKRLHLWNELHVWLW